MVALRKRVTRKANRFSNRPRLRLHTNYAYSALKSGPANDARYARRRWKFLMFHDAPVRALHREYLADPALTLMRKGSDAEVIDALSQGLSDRRTGVFFTRLSGQFRNGLFQELRRYPVKVAPDVLLPPSPAVHPTGSRGERLSFSLPQSVMVCVRRKQRREVLLALGRGGAKHKPPKWNEESHIRC